ncbi:MAG: DUF4337 domain-containing protein [Acidobacteriota bacterium]
MGDLADEVNEAVAHAAESRLNSAIALLVAITATFIAIGNVKDGNIVQEMQQAQASSIDTWSYYQAKGTKQNLAESTRDQLIIQRELGGTALPSQSRAILDRKLADYDTAVKKYETQKAEIKLKAEGYQKEYDALNLHDDQFDLSEAALSMAIALFGVTALTKKRWLMIVASIFMLIGLLYGSAGLFGFSLHSDFAAKLLS